MTDSVNELNKDLFAPEEGDRFSDPIEARKKAMDYLARREYGRLELQAKLESIGFGTETARAAVDRLACEGLQCDRRFIENFIQSRIDQGKGPVRIRLELEERQLQPGLVDEVLAEHGEDWVSMAREIREKKFGPELPLEFEQKARQMRFLQYRGFESGQVRAAVAPHGDD
ncbi:MAG: regulatory protein RecX [Woeseiaceae bacterium]